MPQFLGVPVYGKPPSGLRTPRQRPRQEAIGRRPRAGLAAGMPALLNEVRLGGAKADSSILTAGGVFIQVRRSVELDLVHH